MNKHITIKSLFCLAVLLSLGFIPSQAIMPGPGDGKLIKSALSGNLSRAISGELGKGVKSLHSEISTNISKMARAQRTNIAANNTAKFMSAYATPTVIETVHSVKQSIKRAEELVKNLEQTKDFPTQHQAVLKAVSDEGEMDMLGNTFVKKIRNSQDPATVRESLTHYFHLNETNPTVEFLLDHPNRLDRIPGIEAERKALSLRNASTEEALRNLREITMKTEVENRLYLMEQLREDLEIFVQEHGHGPRQTQDLLERNLHFRTSWLLQFPDATAGIPELEREYQAIRELWNR
ncbi:MAG: hypothetical protein J6V32_01480 [Elusimicrobiaceae bacterium]|nr:hypothetical protein [Elusimicrobiaceae bacterium]